MTVRNVHNCADNIGIRSQRLRSGEFFPDDVRAVTGIETTGFIIVLFVPDSGGDFIRKGFDEIVRAAPHGRVHRAAAGMAQHDNHFTAQMSGGVFDAAQFVFPDDVP